jgi:uncharacterized protein (DUF58 family)
MSWFRRASPPRPAFAAPAPSADVAGNAAGGLFDSAFLAKLERLQMLSRRTFGGQNRAERRSHKIGSSLEFADYRNYSPGDDLRSIDWNIYGRLDKLFLKLFEEEEDLHIYLLVDASESMRWQAVDARTDAPLRLSKLDLARRIAATLAYIGLANLDRINIHYFAAGLGDSLGLGRGKSHFRRVLDFLSRLPEDAGQTDLSRSLRAFGRRTKRRGLAIILSDFFDPRGYEEALGYLLHQRFELQLIHVLDPAELSPRLLGDLRLTDTETGQAYEVTVNESLARAYEKEIGAFLSGLDTFCARHQVGCRRALTDASFEDFVLRTLRSGGGLLR